MLDGISRPPLDPAIKITVDESHVVSGLLEKPTDPIACLALAHGAGAGMTHPFMGAVAAGLSERGVATLRFQFPYMEQGSRRPDRPALAQNTIRAAVARAAREMPSLPLFAGGKSFGGRMTSQAQSDDPLIGVIGLMFFGFPLHAAGKPSDARADHLAAIQVPMLFLQGTRDALANVDLIRATTGRLVGSLATLILVDEADHSFHVPARSDRTDAQTLASLLDATRDWIGSTVASS